jgi:hypothetical protein
VQPYYDKDGITLYCGKNEDVDLPAADLILTDPPYSETTHAGARREAPKATTADADGVRRFAQGGNSAVPLGIAFDSISGDEAGAIFARLAPLAKRWVVSFLDWRHVGGLDAHPPDGLRFVRHMVWVGPNKAPQFTGDRPGTGWESIAVLHNATGRMRWNGGGKHGVYTHNVAHMAHRISAHPNAKPVPLLAQLITDFSDPGDLVLDPFCGSGAVLAAARLTGRRAVGVEQNERHCADIVFYLTHGRPRRVRPPAVSSLQGELDLTG